MQCTKLQQHFSSRLQSPRAWVCESALLRGFSSIMWNLTFDFMLTVTSSACLESGKQDCTAQSMIKTCIVAHAVTFKPDYSNIHIHFFFFLLFFCPPTALKASAVNWYSESYQDHVLATKQAEGRKTSLSYNTH